MDEDTTDAAWFQLEQEAQRQRENQLIARLRRETSGFRDECDEFSATFKQADMALRKKQCVPVFRK
jgi:hypothetical protein